MLFEALGERTTSRLRVLGSDWIADSCEAFLLLEKLEATSLSLSSVIVEYQIPLFIAVLRIKGRYSRTRR